MVDFQRIFVACLSPPGSLHARVGSWGPNAPTSRRLPSTLPNGRQGQSNSPLAASIRRAASGAPWGRSSFAPGSRNRRMTRKDCVTRAGIEHGAAHLDANSDSASVPRSKCGAVGRASSVKRYTMVVNQMWNPQPLVVQRSASLRSYFPVDRLCLRSQAATTTPCSPKIQPRLRRAPIIIGPQAQAGFLRSDEKYDAS